jgi:hypothetical protein
MVLRALLGAAALDAEVFNTPGGTSTGARRIGADFLAKFACLEVGGGPVAKVNGALKD